MVNEQSAGGETPPQACLEPATICATERVHEGSAELGVDGSISQDSMGVVPNSVARQVQEKSVGHEAATAPTPEHVPNDSEASVNPYQLPESIPQGHEFLRHDTLEVIAIGGRGYVYRCQGGLVYKVNAIQREVDLMKAAGDCCIKIISRVTEVLEQESETQVVTSGVIMEGATPFDFKAVAAEDRGRVKDEMVALLKRLHREYGIIHGDLKPANLLRCRDGKLRFCDFDSARRIEEAEEEWEGMLSDRYAAPSRGWPDYTPPRVVDDWYALAISLWELYTGRDALMEEDFECLLKEGGTVDVDAVEDVSVREFIRGILLAGGANV